jgi:hypothetical protein
MAVTKGLFGGGRKKGIKMDVLLNKRLDNNARKAWY